MICEKQQNGIALWKIVLRWAYRQPFCIVVENNRRKIWGYYLYEKETNM